MDNEFKGGFSFLDFMGHIYLELAFFLEGALGEPRKVNSLEWNFFLIISLEKIVSIGLEDEAYVTLGF